MSRENHDSKKSQVQILDATLREGEQQAGVRFSIQEKIQILQLLEEFQVDLVEVGHPGISAEDEQICLEVAQAASCIEILMHARANVEEVKAAKRAKADWVGIWAATNSIATKTKFVEHDQDYIDKKIHTAIAEAKNLDLKVRFTIEDASRTEWEDIEWVGNIALAAGADRLSLADTVGILEPYTCTSLVSRAVATFGCEIEVHLHNDFGLALANALAAVDAGASVIDTSILGIGERTGITDLLQFAVILHQKRGQQYFPLEKIPQLACAVQIATGYQPDELRPVIGKNAFTHTSKYHVQAVKRDPQSYEVYPPELVGRVRKLEEQRPTIHQPQFPFTASKNLRISRYKSVNIGKSNSTV
ncbi:MAG: LeuA family protein [Scytonema sp. PMC 1069.18]|nr:LeuA family protein [Scytonema sp. PMC 1069.18]MEC4879946.1 LeuA family protein [Scytonema sp. PMC 1070.18]